MHSCLPRACRRITLRTRNSGAAAPAAPGRTPSHGRLYAQHRGEVAGVITDMMMPFMDWPATIRALQKMDPQVKIIAASGLAGQDKAAEATSAGVQMFHPKPYTAEKLLKALAELLQKRPG